MKEYILVCRCPGVKGKALAAYNIKHPNEILPEVISGGGRISKLAAELGNEHIKAISRVRDKFAYYVRLDDKNEIVEEIDLIRGTKIR